MKVGTDSIMLGSWINPGSAPNILDVGTGSGLLALMLAQKTPASCKIYGLDIDLNAIKQAQLNSYNSLWHNRLHFSQLALQDLHNHTQWPQQFDLIMSNPPYFAVNPGSNQQNIHKADTPRVQARQLVSLNHLELIQSVNTHLTQNGYFYCIIPADVSEAFIAQAGQQGLFLAQQLQVQSTKNGKIIRQIMKFSRYSVETHYDDLLIYAQAKQYSAQFMQLCRAYYLRF